VDAANALVAEKSATGRVSRLTERDIERHLYTADLPDPDLLIRTSGEMRVSNFLLWQIAYAEIFVTETLWPDFNRARLLESFVEFQKRHRRYGGIGENDEGEPPASELAGK
jgi:undecaprenyl diphosphate synthase